MWTGIFIDWDKLFTFCLLIQKIYFCLSCAEFHVLFISIVVRKIHKKSIFNYFSVQVIIKKKGNLGSIWSVLGWSNSQESMKNGMLFWINKGIQLKSFVGGGGGGRSAGWDGGNSEICLKWDGGGGIHQKIDSKKYRKSNKSSRSVKTAVTLLPWTKVIMWGIK